LTFAKVEPQLSYFHDDNHHLLLSKPLSTALNIDVGDPILLQAADESQFDANESIVLEAAEAVKGY